MTLQEYQKQCNRTCPSLGQGDKGKLDLCHMVLGINSEVEELERAVQANEYINIGEEIADQFWYIGNYCTIRNFSLETLFNSPLVQQSTGMSFRRNVAFLYATVAKMQDNVKKFIAYDKPMKEEEIVIQKILWALNDICTECNLDLPTILNNNIEKLKVRFPEKFTKELAINRNLEAERAELEK